MKNFKLPFIPCDKANHFIYGLLIFSLSYPVVGALIAGIISTVVAGAKEVYDYRTPGHESSWLDIVWTLAGSSVAAILILLF